MAKGFLQFCDKSCVNGQKLQTQQSTESIDFFTSYLTVSKQWVET